MRVRRVVCACALALAAASPAAAQQRTRVAILELSIEGDAPPELRTQLERSLAGGLYAAEYEVIPRDVALEKLRPSPELIGCISTTCLERIGDKLDATRFVRARVEASGATYAMEIELLGADGSRIRRETTCAVCTVVEANDAMSKLAAQLDEKAPAEVKVSIRTRPSGAALSVDGKPVGQAPAQVTLSVGDHVVEASKPGFRSERKQVAVVDQHGAGAQEVVIDLDAERRFGAWKWVAVGGAVAAIATGVYLISIDGDCTESTPTGVECPELHDTMLPGAGIAALGAGLAGVSVWMFLTDRPSIPSERSGAALLPTRGGAIGVWTFRF